MIRQRGKTRITIHIDDEVLEAFRQRADTAGRGYQTMINEALREHLGQSGDDSCIFKDRLERAV